MLRVLSTLIPVLALAAVATLAQAEPGDPAKGQPVYAMYCVTCHGEKGDGQGPVGKTLDPPPRDFAAGDFKYGGTDQDIFDVISNGAASKGGSPLMAPWGAVIPEADRWALVAYIHTLKK
jgi:mono/diheme cytochrome c family protein